MATKTFAYRVDPAEADQGATGNGQSLKALVDTIGAENATIYFTHHGSASTTYTLTTSESLSGLDNIKVVFQQGAKIDGAGTITFDSPEQIEAGERQQIFGSSITVAFTKGGTVYPEWWGAKADDSTDCTVAIQSAIDSRAGELMVKFSGGKYTTTDTITIANHRIVLCGLGPKITYIMFEPTAHNKICFLFDLVAASSIVQCGVRHLTISSDDTTYTKVGIKLIDVTEFRLFNISINQLNGATSVGLEIAGRDTSSFIDVEIYANVPIHVTKNPNTATSDCTAMNFHNLYLISVGLDASTDPIWKIDTNCWVVGLSITGNNTFAGGKYGIYMNDSDTTSDMYNWNLENIIWEQVSDANAYFLYLVANTCLTSVSLKNVYVGPASVFSGNFLYLRKVEQVVVDCCYFDGVGWAANLDGTTYPFEMRNTYIKTGGNGLSTTTLVNKHHFVDSDYYYTLWVKSTFSALATLTVDSGTPTVSKGEAFQTANLNATTYTNFGNAYAGKCIKVLINDVNSTIDFTGTNLKGNVGVDWSPTTGDWMECVFDGTNWFCSVHDCTA